MSSQTKLRLKPTRSGGSESAIWSAAAVRLRRPGPLGRIQLPLWQSVGLLSCCTFGANNSFSDDVVHATAQQGEPARFASRPENFDLQNSLT